MALPGRKKKPPPKSAPFWEAAPKRGRRPLYDNPEDLWGDCVDYFEWVEANPLKEDKVYAFQGKVRHEPNAKMRAMSIGGLCIFLGIAHRTWIDWRQGRQEFSQVITRVETIISNQKFEGAAAELLNANIIARDLGLVEKQAVDHSGQINIEGAKNDLAANLARAVAATGAPQSSSEGST